MSHVVAEAVAATRINPDPQYFGTMMTLISYYPLTRATHWSRTCASPTWNTYGNVRPTFSASCLRRASCIGTELFSQRKLIRRSPTHVAYILCSSIFSVNWTYIIRKQRTRYRQSKYRKYKHKQPQPQQKQQNKENVAHTHHTPVAQSVCLTRTATANVSLETSVV